MFSVSDLRVSVSSIQFSLLLDSKLNLCPKCGHVLDTSPLAEVTLSSVLILLGVGSIVLYKWMSDKNRKRRGNKQLPLAFAKTISTDNYSHEWTVDGRQELTRSQMLSSTPFIKTSMCGDFYDSRQSIASQDSDLMFNLSQLTDDNEGSIHKTSFASIGNKTVAKLDQLLEQIRDIKESVCEIDQQIDIFDVKFEPKMFSLGPDITESDPNDSLNLNPIFITEPETPTLEWDSMDLNDRLVPSLDSVAPVSSIGDLNSFTNVSLPMSAQLESPQDLTSPSTSTSGEFSLASNPEQSSDGTQSHCETIQRIISDAKKLGIFNDLVDILVIKSKRDSAYFED